MLLKNLCSFNKGIQIKRDLTSIDYVIPYLHYGDLYKKYNVKLNLDEIHSEIIKVDNSFYNSKYQINNNDIVMNLTSENYDDLGKCIIVKNSENKPFLAGMETHLIKIHSSSIIPEYLNYYFESDSFLKCIQQFITGMKVFRVKPTDILNIDISLPNLQYQQHIVDIIGSLDDKIENNNKIIEKMNNILNVKTNELLLYKTRKIQLNDIIEECKEKSEIELVPYSVINTGKVIIQNEQFNKEIAKNTKGKYKKIKKDYFVYNPSRINIGSIGEMEDEIGCVSPIYVVFKCIEEYKIYLQQLLTFDSMIKEINKRCSGSVRQALSFNDLCSIEIYDIEKEKLKIYNKYCDSIIRITKKLEQENKLLENQKKLYLAKFF